MAIAPKPAQGQQAAAGIGLNPDAFIAGGGLFTDFDGTILEALFTPFDYGGTVDPPVLAFALEILNEEEEKEDGKNPFIQYYSAGDMKNFVPSADGKEAIPVGSKTGLSKSTNAFKMIGSMIKAGFDASQIGQRVDVFEGHRFHFKREEQEARKGLKDSKPREDGRAREILLAETYLGVAGAAGSTAGKKPLPGKPLPPKAGGQTTGKPLPPKTAPATTSAAPATAAAPTATGYSSEAQEAASNYIIEVLAAADGNTAAKVGLASAFIGWAKTAGADGTALPIPVRNQAIQALGNDNFLGMEGLGWVYDGQNLTLG